VQLAVRVCLGVNLAVFLHYTISLSYEISTYLGIKVFKVGGPTATDKRRDKKS
jgi:hypothetical protein